LALQVGEVSSETVKYGREFCVTSTQEKLLWQGPEAIVQEITDPTSRQRERYKITNSQLPKEYFKEKEKLVTDPRWVPDTKTGWPTSTSIYLTLSAALGPGVISASNRNEYDKKNMWHLLHLTTLWASKACCRDRFTLFTLTYEFYMLQQLILLYFFAATIFSEEYRSRGPGLITGDTKFSEK
jgi:hypothetical protein